MVALAVKAEAYTEAVTFVAAAEIMREVTGVVASPSEIEQLQQFRLECRAALGAPAYAAAVNAGDGVSGESATGVALRWLATVA
jgi:hypothetical protein